MIKSLRSFQKIKVIAGGFLWNLAALSNLPLGCSASVQAASMFTPCTQA
jgi:hypothetical protein